MAGKGAVNVMEWSDLPIFLTITRASRQRKRCAAATFTLTAGKLFARRAALPNSCPAPLAKNILPNPSVNHFYKFAHPASMQRGVTANRHETWGGVRWTRRCRVRMRLQGEVKLVSDREGVRDERH